MPSGLTIGTEKSKALQQAIMEELMKWGYSTEPDKVMAEYITIMIINNKTPDQITGELEELIGTEFDRRFTDWLFAEAAKVSSDTAEAPVSEISASKVDVPAEPAQTSDSSRRQSGGGPRNGIYQQALSQALPTSHKRTASARSPSPSHPNKIRRTDLPTGPRAMHRDGPSNSRSLIDRMGPVRPNQRDEVQARIDEVTSNSFPEQMMPVMDGNMQNINNPIGLQEIMVGQMALMAQLMSATGMLPMGAPGADMGMMMPGMQPGFQDGHMNGNGRGRGRGGRGMRGSGRGRGYGRGENRNDSDIADITMTAQEPEVPVPTPVVPIASPDPTAAQRPGFVLPERPQSPTLCKFNTKCNNAHCRYSHASPVATAESGLVLSNEACENGKDCKDQDCTKSHVSPAVFKPQAEHSVPNAHVPHAPPPPQAYQNPSAFQPQPNAVPCRFGAACTRPNCMFQHPPRFQQTNFAQPCKFGAGCTRASCAFQHPDGRVLPTSFHRGLSTSSPLVNVPTPETGTMNTASPHKSLSFNKNASMKQKLEQQMKEIEEKKMEAENAVRAAQAAAASRKESSAA